MKYNQFSYIETDLDTQVSELKKLGFILDKHIDDRKNLELFLDSLYFNITEKDDTYSLLLANFDLSLLDFFKSKNSITADIFYTIALQLLGFIPHVDFTHTLEFIKQINLPIKYKEGQIISSLYHLLLTKQKGGMILLDDLISKGYLPTDNDYHFFNGKSLATFDTSNLIREAVYIETPLDTDHDGTLDIIKAYIIRPKTKHSIPTIMTASPYHAGTNGIANDKKLHDMQQELVVKDNRDISICDIQLQDYTYPSSNLPVVQANEQFGHVSSYKLNDYFLARGFANIYVSGIGTAGSTGFMTSGDYQQIESFKAVINWLNGRATAYTSPSKKEIVTADWSNGLVATTGKSYLGTMSTGLATTGVKGLEVIIAESAISSWYDYYRENGLICSPGGYPGEDLDVLTELTYSRNLLGGDYLANNTKYQELLNQQSQEIDRHSGDYNNYWHKRNYLPHASNTRCEVVYTHGLQDWNVKPRQVFNIFNAFPKEISKHLFLHHGEHVYMHNWQSIDFKECMNSLLSQKLLGHHNSYHLAELIWQDNTENQHWKTLPVFGAQNAKTLHLGKDKQLIDNHYPKETFERYSKNFNVFKDELFKGQAHQLLIDLTISEDILLNGEITLHLTLKSSTNKGILSAQILDYGSKKRLPDSPAIIELDSIDNGQNFAREDLKEISLKESNYRVITKGVMNLQNRHDLLKIEPVNKQEWMTFDFKLQPSIYQLKANDRLRILLYTTDFEHTIRDNSNYILTVDLEQSSLIIPY